MSVSQISHFDRSQLLYAPANGNGQKTAEFWTAQLTLASVGGNTFVLAKLRENGCGSPTLAVEGV